MKRAFLYIDILGFGSLVKTKSEKVDKIFKIFDGLNAFKHHSLQVIIFSDTILLFNKEDNWSKDYFTTYLIEYAQELFYKLSWINVYFRGIITFGEFNYNELENFQAYYGEALIETYKDEENLNGFGLYINKELNREVVVFEKVDFDEKYDFVLLCQSYINLYDDTNGKLPIEIDMFTETDTYFRIEEDLRFFREIEFIKNNHPSEKVQKKYQTVYNIYKRRTKEFFEKFENEGFIILALNSDYIGSINPFEILAEKEKNVWQHRCLPYTKNSQI